jgi:DNA processing protein
VRTSFEVGLPAGISALEALTDLAPGFGVTERRDALERAQKIVDESERLGIQILPIRGEINYPVRLRSIGDPPAFIYVKGTLPDDWNAAIAIIGTRTPSPVSLDVTNEIVEALSHTRACVVVSGLALGIDTAAHASALKNRLRTVAVLGHGLDRIYPRNNAALARQIIDGGGALLSEYPVGVPVRRFRLDRRDRIQSALSSTTVLVESAIDGGSMRNVNFAKHQGRHVIALEPLGAGADWSGNSFLLGSTLAGHVPRFLRQLAGAQRPLADRLPRTDVTRVIAREVAACQADDVLTRVF